MVYVCANFFVVRGCASGYSVEEICFRKFIIIRMIISLLIFYAFNISFITKSYTCIYLNLMNKIMVKHTH